MNELDKNDAQSLMAKAAACFRETRKSIVEGMGYLYQIHETGAWSVGGWSSFGEYCEQACGVSQSFASKLISVHKHYVNNGVDVLRLRAVDAEKLYLASSLPGTPEEQVIKAETLTRQEIKDELASGVDGDCEHPTRITICSRCHRKVDEKKETVEG